MRPFRVVTAGLAASLWVAGFAGVGGCAAMQSAQSGIGAATSGVSSATGTVKGVEDTGSGLKSDYDSHAAKFKGGNGGGGGGNDGDPDGDGKRSSAKEAKPNEPITDTIDPGKNDRADWRFFNLGGAGGKLTVELHWDDDNALLGLDVYDSLGANV